MQETQETWVRSVGQKNTQEEEMAIHSSIVASDPMDRGAWQAIYSPNGHKESDTTEHTCTLYTGKYPYYVIINLPPELLFRMAIKSIRFISNGLRFKSPWT